MQLAEGLRLDKVRCASAHLAAGVDPAGTAPVWDAVLVVEVPGPWPRDISAAEPFRSLTDAVRPTLAGADGRVWRPQGVVPGEPGGGTRVMAFERTRSGPGPFTRREWVVPDGEPERVVQLCAALVASDADAQAGFEQWRDDPPEGTVDLLVCTHGTRDVCCGGQGPPLCSEVAGALGAAGGRTAQGAPARLWRTSHAGGHRFAPTGVSFPEGVAWAHLDAGAALSVLRRDGDPASLAGHVRGAVTVAGPQAQVADREGFAVHGWGWWAAERTAVLVAHDRTTLASSVEVLGRLPDGADVGVRARVELDHHIAMPTCGAVEEPELATEPVWRVAARDVLALDGRARAQ